MRPHQKAGIQFMFECLMGTNNDYGNGVILADEMGLGKTLQCIALAWTLLRQGPDCGKPVVKRVLIVVPSSLVENWRKEFKKWLGDERLCPFVISGSTKVVEYMKMLDTPIDTRVLIISYEMFKMEIDLLHPVKFDLLICDEGHRLKNKDTKTNKQLSSIGTDKRILLTGTPIQNDLKELYSLVDFVNPNALKKYSRFQREYEDPILCAQEPGASLQQLQEGRDKGEKLAELLSKFVIRRTHANIEKYLTINKGM